MNILALGNHVGDFGFGPPDELIDSAEMDLEHLLLCITVILEEIEGNSLLHKSELWCLQVSNFECSVSCFAQMLSEFHATQNPGSF